MSITFVERYPALSIAAGAFVPVVLLSGIPLFLKLLLLPSLSIIALSGGWKVAALSVCASLISFYNVFSVHRPPGMLVEGRYLGEVVSVKRFHGGGGFFIFKPQGFHGSVKVRVKGPFMLWGGEKVSLWMRPRKIKSFKNPGAFDYARYMALKGVFYEAWVGDKALRVVSKGGLISRIRERVWRLGEGVKDDRIKGIFLSLVLGERGMVPPEDMELIKKAGLMHIFAISGLHLVVIFLFFRELFFKLFSVSRRLLELGYAVDISSLLALLISLIYALLVGFPTPTKRAFVGLLIFVLFSLMGRRRKLLDAVVGSLVFITTFHTKDAFTLSFYLSFIATFSIVLSYLYFRKRELSGFKMYLVLNLVPFLSTLPIVALFFGYIPVFAPIFNLALLPVISGYTLPGVLLVSWLYVIFPFDFLSSLIPAIIKPMCLYALVDKLPFTVLDTVPKDVLFILSAAFFVFSLKRKVFIAPSLALLAIWAVSGPRPGIFFFDVGRGSAAAIVFGEEAFLFDTGPSRRAGLSISSSLRWMGVRRVTVFLTSRKRGSLGGLKAVKALFEPLRVIYPEDVKKWRLEKGVLLVSNGSYLAAKFGGFCFYGEGKMAYLGDCKVVQLPGGGARSLFSKRVFHLSRPDFVVVQGEGRRIHKEVLKELGACKVFYTSQGCLSFRPPPSPPSLSPLPRLP